MPLSTLSHTCNVPSPSGLSSITRSCSSWWTTSQSSWAAARSTSAASNAPSRTRIGPLMPASRSAIASSRNATAKPVGMPNQRLSACNSAMSVRIRLQNREQPPAVRLAQQRRVESQRVDVDQRFARPRHAGVPALGAWRRCSACCSVVTRHPQSVGLDLGLAACHPVRQQPPGARRHRPPERAVSGSQLPARDRQGQRTRARPSRAPDAVCSAGDTTGAAAAAAAPGGRRSAAHAGVDAAGAAAPGAARRAGAARSLLRRSGPAPGADEPGHQRTRRAGGARA